MALVVKDPKDGIRLTQAPAIRRGRNTKEARTLAATLGSSPASHRAAVADDSRQSDLRADKRRKWREARAT